MKADRFAWFVGRAGAAGRGVRRLGVRLAVGARAVKAARFALERLRIGRTGRLRALLAGIVYLVDDDVDTPAAFGAPHAWLKAEHETG